jgi:hypothetical protein
MKPSPWKSPRCPICGAGFTLKQRPTPQTLRLIEEAIEAHQAQHEKLAASGSKPTPQRLEALFHPLR